MVIMSDASAMARRMSYRKPVPIYVPSPPTSPHLAPKELDDQGAVLEGEVPPLPDNWREIISTKTKEVNSSKVSLLIGQKEAGGPTTKETGPHNSTDGSGVDEDQRPITLLSTTNKLVASRKHPTRGLPTQYRPPTPPLRSPKVQKFPSENIARPEDAISLSISHCDPHNSPGPSLSAPLPTFMTTPSLKLSPSFMSDKTIISQNNMPSWSQSLGTLATGWPPNSQKKPMEDVWSLSESPDQDRTFYSCWTSLANMGTRLKNLFG